MDTPQLYLAPEVAALLGVSIGTLPAKWRRLNQTHGFPRPLPGRFDAWSRVLVDEWIATPDDARGLRTVTVASNTRRQQTVARQRQVLETRYAPGGHAHG